ncbi:MAG: hypothetical protein KC474_04925 [Cyanobacteria bacterium HKST-UBA04]|nr:hypothetical protein [Cyanobacteria bacterium HKST-UBA04]
MIAKTGEKQKARYNHGVAMVLQLSVRCKAPNSSPTAAQQRLPNNGCQEKAGAQHRVAALCNFVFNSSFPATLSTVWIRFVLCDVLNPPPPPACLRPAYLAQTPVV